MSTDRAVTREREASPPVPIESPDVYDTVLRVESEYREMPGLSLTVPQAARLWGLDHATCTLVLLSLVQSRVLKRTANGAYVRR